MDKKIKVLVYGDLVTRTGFSTVLHSIFNNLSGKLDLVGLGINYRGDPIPPKIVSFPVFPAGNGGDIYGINRIKEFVNDNLDIIFILDDVWVTNKFLEEIKRAWTGKKLPKIVCYIPIDAEEHDSSWYENFDIVDVPVAYTEFGKRVILKAAPQLGDRIRIIPHGTDTDTFYPVDRKEARHILFGPGNSIDTFVFLNAGRNQPRKKLDITMEAFKLFSDGKEDVKLYLHSGIQDMHLDLARLAVRLGIDNKLILTNLNKGPQQIPEERLNLIYNSCNVGINTGLGEGWGLTSTEHACTGAPQIVPNHSACAELFSDCGLVVPTKVDWIFDNIMTVGKIVLPEDVAEAMNLIYTDKELYRKLEIAGVNKFTDPKYQWKTISETWFKIFEELINDTVTLA